MKRKLQGQRMPKSTVRIGHGKSELLYASQYQHGDGVELQVYACGADGKLVWAGVERHGEISAETAWKVQRLWQRWRNEYDNLPENRLQDYPAKHCPKVARITLFPIDSPALAQTFVR